MDLIFAGLIRKFGKENVIDYPPRKKFRQGKPTLVGDHEKDYGAERRSLSYVEGCESLCEWSRPEIISEIMKGNIETVFLDETQNSFMHLAELFVSTGKEREVKIAVIAGHDSFRGEPSVVLDRRFGGHCTMFIDDWKPGYNELKNTHLTNLSCNFDHLWNVSKREEYLQNKVYDICFIGYNSNPVRKVVIDHVKSKWGHLNNCIIFEERQDKFDNFVRHDEMFRMMAQSRICLNLPGASTGGRALRYYEIPHVGSAMLTMRVQAKLLDPQMGEQFSSLQELDEKIEQLLEDGNFNRGVASRDYINSSMHHVDARMDYVFKILDNK